MAAGYAKPVPPGYDQRTRGLAVLLCQRVHTNAGKHRVARAVTRGKQIVLKVITQNFGYVPGAERRTELVEQLVEPAIARHRPLLAQHRARVSSRKIKRCIGREQTHLPRIRFDIRAGFVIIIANAIAV